MVLRQGMRGLQQKAHMSEPWGLRLILRFLFRFTLLLRDIIFGLNLRVLFNYLICLKINLIRRLRNRCGGARRCHWTRTRLLLALSLWKFGMLGRSPTLLGYSDSSSVVPFLAHLSEGVLISFAPTICGPTIFLGALVLFAWVFSLLFLYGTTCRCWSCSIQYIDVRLCRGGQSQLVHELPLIELLLHSVLELCLEVVIGHRILVSQNHMFVVLFCDGWRKFTNLLNNFISIF